MKKIYFVIIVILTGLGSLSAQTFYGKINPAPSQNPVILNSTDTLKILCALVEFQEDRFDQTYGDGKFGSIYSKEYGNEILDPLPHDVNYFSNHMLFAQNYFRKVSKGKANISYDFLPGIITVSQPMRNYSPAQSSETFSELGNLAQEVWQLADQNFADVNYGDYDLFFIFHAGVGRDIVEVTADFGRFDLPSIYLSNNQLKKIFGNDFNGFPVQNGNFRITNTAVLPETESREVSIIGGTALIELTINGLIVSTIASHLGLPDLFNTETGRTAIGRFGLMDGQAFFAYSGLFPPEPSPWEKIYLGWEEPVTITPGNYNITLSANLTASITDTTILRVPINSSEYYLIENRKRDARKDGAVVTSIINGEIKVQTFAKDDTAGFNSFNIKLIDGVVIDIDEYDWAVPGFEDEQLLTDPFEDLGLVIWHIDESIINAKIAENKINADQNSKGIRIVEADGIVDIGEEFTSIFGDVVVGEGTRQDTWYQNNPSEYYENKFTPETKPNTNSNTGGSSLINFENFSAVGNKMSFSLSYGTEFVDLKFSQKLNVDGTISSFKSAKHNSQIYSAVEFENDIYIFINGLQFRKLENFSDNDFVFTVYNSVLYLISTYNELFNVFAFGDDENPSYTTSLGLGDRLTSAMVADVEATANGIEVSVGDETGAVKKILVQGYPDLQFIIFDIDNPFPNEAVKQIAYDKGNYTAVSNNKFFDVNGTVVTLPGNIYKSVLTKENTITYNSVVLTSGNYFYIISKGQIINSFQIKSENEITEFSVADLFSDGNNYILVANGNKIEAYNFNGALAEGFPFVDTKGRQFKGTPLIADLDNDGDVEIIVVSNDGRIIAYTPKTKKILNGFPLASGADISVVPQLISNSNSTEIVLVNDDNYLFDWIYNSQPGEILWNGNFKNDLNTSFVEIPETSNSISEFFPENKVYNYPNPVYEGETNIRYFVAEDSKIEIKIFDLAGDLVADISADATGGMDNETKWNVTDIQSGVYFARVQATGVSGKSQFKLIKIAVIK